MKFFDSLADASFKNDAHGRPVYFPWGNFGKGFVVESQERFDALYAFQRKTMKFSIIVLIGLMFLIGPILPLLILPFYTLWFWRKTRKLTDGLKVSDMKLTLRDTQDAKAKTLPMGLLVFFAVFSVLLFFVGLLMALAGFNTIISLLMSATFAYVSFVYLRLIRVRRQSEKPEAV